MTEPDDATGSDDTSRADDTSGPALSEDERGLLDAFDRLSPEGSVEWGFADAMRRLSSPDDRGTWVEPWYGLPADLWDRGRGAKASERVLGDVITRLAQEMTEYAQRIVDDVRRTVPADSAVFDAFRYLEARVARLEAAGDPLGIRPADLALPVPDASEWADHVPSWLDGPGGPPVVIGELGDRSVLDAVAVTGTDVDAVDPRAVLAWSARDAAPARPGQVRVTVGDVGEHLGRLPAGCRSGIVLSGCVDRVPLAAKVGLVTGALRALVSGGALVVLTTDQVAWDAELEPTLRDLLPGRPFHPDTWSVVLSHLGLVEPEVHRAGTGRVHAVVARRPR